MCTPIKYERYAHQSGSLNAEQLSAESGLSQHVCAHMCMPGHLNHMAERYTGMLVRRKRPNDVRALNVAVLIQ
jgi:hypothetical protein